MKNQDSTVNAWLLSVIYDLRCEQLLRSYTDSAATMRNRAEKDAVRWCHLTHQVFAGGISS